MTLWRCVAHNAPQKEGKAKSASTPFVSVKLPASLVNQAREAAQTMRRSVASQIEYWATLGRALEHAGLTTADMRSYLEHVADRRLLRLGLEPMYGSPNPLAFMELQDVQELSNFFERRVSAYQVGVTGAVGFDEDF